MLFPLEMLPCCPLRPVDSSDRILDFRVGTCVPPFLCVVRGRFRENGRTRAYACIRQAGRQTPINRRVLSSPLSVRTFAKPITDLPRRGFILMLFPHAPLPSRAPFPCLVLFEMPWVP